MKTLQYELLSKKKAKTEKKRNKNAEEAEDAPNLHKPDDFFIPD
jgi:hypothetical protein